ncbi:MAG: GtrA family protein [Actinomycetia bacterium]|nr:GtrA family protein [Actinomycetes bacterium]
MVHTAAGWRARYAAGGRDHARGHTHLNLILDLYSRFRTLVHEVGKFGIVGAIGAVVQFGVQNPLHYHFGVGALTAVFCGYVTATCVTFAGNRYWTYRDRRGESQGFVRESATFIVMNVIGIGIQEGLVALATYGLGWKDGFSFNAATVIGIGIATLFRLYAYRTFVFRVSTPASGAVEQLEPETTRYR